MADLALGVAKDIIKTGMAIKDAVDTFQENEEECQDILKLVSRLTEILSLLEERGLTSHLTMCGGALEGLHRSLDGALKIITKWQKRNGTHRFLRARDMAKQLRRVQDDIEQNMNFVIFVATMQLIEWTRINTTTVQCEGGHPPPTQLQNEAEMEMYSSHSTTGDAGSYDNEIITMVTTGTEAHSAPSSGVTEFTLSETVATHHVSEENMNGGNSYTSVLKQKIVVKVSMPCAKSRAKAMALVSALDGVSSMGITGDGKDLIEVVGHCVDTVCLVICLRKKIGHTEILQVEELKDKKPDERKPEEPLPGEPSSSVTSSEATPQDCNNQHQEHCGTPIHRTKASGDPIEKPQLQLEELQPEAPPARVYRERAPFTDDETDATCSIISEVGSPCP